MLVIFVVSAVQARSNWEMQASTTTSICQDPQDRQQYTAEHYIQVGQQQAWKSSAWNKFKTKSTISFVQCISPHACKKLRIPPGMENVTIWRFPFQKEPMSSRISNLFTLRWWGMWHVSVVQSFWKANESLQQIDSVHVRYICFPQVVIIPNTENSNLNPTGCCCSKWNYNEIRRLLPNATFITILRDPVDCFESNFVYMGLQLDFGMDINQFAGSEVLHIKF